MSSYDETARVLAAAHKKNSPETTEIFLARDPDQKEIRLLEVDPDSPTTGELYPYGFSPRPDLGIDFPSVVLLLSTLEWDDVKGKRLALPSGWELENLEQLL